MKRVYLTILFACIFAIGAQAQTPTPTPSDPATTQGNVSRVTYLDVKTGKGTEFSNFMRTNNMPLLAEQKRQGLIVDYKYFGKPTTDGPGDWDVAVMITYRSYAEMIDANPERGAKFDAISLKHYGSAEARTKAGDLIDELRTVVSSHIIREFTINPMKK